MNSLKAALEAHPSLGWFGSFLALFLSWISWLLTHVTAIAQILALGGAVFGFMAGYYTWRIQRDSWRERKARHRRDLFE